MSTWQIILIPVVLLVIGLIRQIFIPREKYRRLRIADEFLCNFTEWFNSLGKECATYNWLVERSDTIQTILGRDGRCDFSDPIRKIRDKNWAIVRNALPDIVFNFNHPDYCLSPSRSRRNLQLATFVENCLLRFIGSTKEQIRQEKKQIGRAHV